MKLLKSILSTSVLILVLASCSKEDSALNTENDYFISFEVNGTEVLYTELLKAERNTLGTNFHGITITGTNFNGPNTNEDIGIILIDNTEITTGTYTQQLNPNTNTSEAFISYIKDGQGYSSVYPSLSTVASATVTVTNITEEYIEGHFSSKMVDSSGDYDKITHNITNGKFKIKLEEGTNTGHNPGKSEYNIAFKANGEDKNFSGIYTSIQFNKIVANNLYLTTIVGALGGEALILYAYDTEPFVTGKTYTEIFIPNHYISSATIAYGISGNSYVTVAPILSNTSKANITFTEITSTYVAGTFSAIMVTNDDYNTIGQTLEAGSFKIKL